MASVDRAAHAVDALGWDGLLLHDLNLFGDRVDVVVRTPRSSAIASHRPAAHDIELVGVLVRREDWRAARRVAAGFSALAQVAVDLAVATSDEACDAERLGIGLVVGAEPEVDVLPAPLAARVWTPAHEAVNVQVVAAIEDLAAAVC